MSRQVDFNPNTDACWSGRSSVTVAVTDIMGYIAARYRRLTPPWPGNPVRFVSVRAPVPFEELLIPFVQYAAEVLASRTGCAYALLSDEAHSELERALMLRLARLTVRTFYLEFALYRASVDSPWDRLLRLLHEGDSRELYLAFIDRMLSGGLPGFFAEYTVLAGLVSTLIELWIDAAAELLQRLSRDREALGRVFNSGEDPGVVVGLNPMASDPHRGGRFVVELTFASGMRLVYKPRSLGVEAAFSSLLGWLNGKSTLLRLSAPQILNREEYGWVEYVERRPWASSGEAERYSQRVGMFLCLLYMLGATDCHYQNLITNGEHIVLPDLETLLHPDVPQKTSPPATSAAARRAYDKLRHSVLGTGLLPSWQVGQRGRVVFDISGLGVSDNQETPFMRLRWHCVNMDNMQAALDAAPIRTEGGPFTTSGTTSDGERMRLSVECLIQGFRQMYRLLIGCRDQMLASNGPLSWFCGHRVRFLFRRTTFYAQLLECLTDPDSLRDQSQWLAVPEVLRDCPASVEAVACQRMIDSEKRALRRLDIPVFTASTDGTSLTLDGAEVVEDVLELPSIERARARLSALCEADLVEQISLIRVAFHTRAVTSVHVDGRSKANRQPERVRPPTAEELVGTALKIARQVKEHAIVGADGSATWIAPKLLPSGKHVQLMPVGYDLYDGVAGIGLFLAAVGRTAGQGDYCDLAARALSTLKAELEARDGAQDLARQMGIGGAVGLGSVVYGLVRSAELLGEPGLLEAAALAAMHITQEAVCGDCWLDVIGGVAGAILGLLSLYKCTGDDTYLATSVACGWHLVKAQRDLGGGKRAWRAGALDHALTGFAHGAAGIAYALLRLYEVTEETAFREAASQGIAWEESVFSLGERNWPDFRGMPGQGEQPGFMTAWCHGAPGIGLARLGTLHVYGTQKVRSDIEIAIETTCRAGMGDRDHVCCGNMGRVEVLLSAGRLLARQDLVRRAYGWAGAIAERSAREARFALNPKMPREIVHPGFFQGLSGIGYELLRLASPEHIPCVLLWA